MTDHRVDDGEVDDAAGLGSAAPSGDGAPVSRESGLDGLRAIAALAVLVFHAADVTGRTAVGTGSGFLRHLDVGVAVFFVLSGALLYRPFVRSHLFVVGPPPVGRYLLRRAIRILPAYWVALTAAVWLLDVATIRTFADGVWLYGLGQIYSAPLIFGGLVQAWSLCTEAAFYVFLPVYAALLRAWCQRLAHHESQVRAEHAGLAALVLVSVVFRVVLSEQGYAVGHAWLPAYLDWFALGMLLAVSKARLEAGVAGPFVVRVLGAPTVTCWAAAAALYFALVSLRLPIGLEPVSTGEYLGRQTLGGLVALFLVAPIALRPRRRDAVSAVVSSRVLTSLGLISYGIFLWHLPILEVVEDWLHDPFERPPSLLAVLVPGLGLTLVAALVSYVVIERPLLNLTAPPGSARGRHAAPPRGG